jgi:hypothetical protein
VRLRRILEFEVLSRTIAAKQTMNGYAGTPAFVIADAVLSTTLCARVGQNAN